MNFKRNILGMALWVSAIAVHAQTQSVTYRIDFFHDDATPAQARAAADAVEAVIGEKDRPQKQVGLYPETLPVTPGAPSFKTVNLGPFSQRVLNCDGAYAQFNWSKDISANALGGNGEKYTGCVFVSQAGIRSSIIIERYTRSSGSILGGIVGGIRNAIQGDDSQWGDKVVERFTGIYKAHAPTALVELIETPNGFKQPDGAKVGEILSKAKQQAATAVAAATPVVVAQPAAPQGVAAVIEARKNLTAMGMTYHSVDQLQEAIARRDQVSVDLFVAANGVRADAKGKSGKTCAEIAQSVGDDALVESVKQLK